MGGTDLLGSMQIRYAVAGMPIQHSLSPVLAVLTATHLKQAGLEVELDEINLLESKDVTSPMAWAWVNKNRQQIEIHNQLYGDPSTTSSHSHLHRVASRRLIRSIQLLARRVSDPQPEAVPRRQPVHPSD